MVCKKGVIILESGTSTIGLYLVDLKLVAALSLSVALPFPLMLVLSSLLATKDLSSGTVSTTLWSKSPCRHSVVGLSY